MSPTGAILESWVDLGKSRQARLAQEEIAFFWVMVPNKHTVYPEMLPAFARTGQPECENHRFSSAIRTSVPSFLDLRSSLRDARGERSLYHHTDTHWNQLGAAFGVKQLIESIRNEFPEVPEFSLDDFEVVIEDEPFEGDLAARLGVYGEHYEESFVRLKRKAKPKARLASLTQPIDLRVHSREDRIVEFSTGRTELPTAWVFHDSYGFATMDLLAEHFESIRFVNSTGMIDFAMLELNPPDLVISLFLEGKLASFAPSDDSPHEARESAIANVGKRQIPKGAAW
jgi:hypothetical protein